MVKDSSSGAATPHYQKPLVTQKQATVEDRMNSCNNNKYISKCYLNFVKIVPVRMESREPLV